MEWPQQIFRTIFSVGLQDFKVHLSIQERAHLPYVRKRRWERPLEMPQAIPCADRLRSEGDSA